MRFTSLRQFLHQSLKHDQCIAQPKGHAITFKNPTMPTLKAVYCFDASSIFICQNPNLSSRHKKMSSSYQTLQPLLNSCEGVGVLLHMCVQAVEVNTES